jgi:RHS repeat-associated protein
VYPSPEEILDFFTRGFTGHEHLDMFGLINMNGRMYDPVIARFLSPDPFVQAPTFTQSFNRYSYVRNNPLSYIDPTGYRTNELGGVGYHYYDGQRRPNPPMGGGGMYQPSIHFYMGMTAEAGGPGFGGWDLEVVGSDGVAAGGYAYTGRGFAGGVAFAGGGFGRGSNRGGRGSGGNNEQRKTQQQQLELKLNSMQNGQTLSGAELAKLIGVPEISKAIRGITRTGTNTFDINRTIWGRGALKDSPLTIDKTKIDINGQLRDVYKIQIDFTQFAITTFGVHRIYYLNNNRLWFQKDGEWWYYED